ncbi:MAG TPA: zinc-dependent metalloprotease [Actinomycetales bacterium]|nr:zinc-dependent metalloprotease [Actinomycetales bacterium]
MSEDQPFPEEPEGDIFELLASLMGGDREAVERALSQSGINPADLEAMRGQMPGLPMGMDQMFSSLMGTQASGPVNWDLAHNIARQTAVSQGDPSVGPRVEKECIQALNVANLWLSPVTEIPEAAIQTRVWARSEWVEATLETWRELTEPIAASVANAMAEVMRESGMEVSAMPGLGIDPTQMLRQFGGAVFGMQVGNAIGTLAQEVLGAGDIGLALVSKPTAALIPTNIAALAESFEEPEAELRLFIALRETALARLFTYAPWLRSRLASAVEDYASGISIDMDQLEETVRSIDPNDPQALQEALGGGVFEVQKSPQQQAALERLETLLALVDGWVDVVVADAAAANLPRVDALREIMTRRRAVGGPAEQTFAGLVGLELRPRRLREASRLWSIIGSESGQEGRDDLWSHPDMLPTAEDLDDPAGFTQRRAATRAAEADLDDALAQILDSEPPEPGDTSGQDDPSKQD